MGKKRNVRTDSFQHIYQITFDKGIIFCTAADCVVLFTLICIKALKHKARIIALTIMLNHFHIEASFPTPNALASFMNEVTSSFARAYNRKYGLSGKVFHKPYGSAAKTRDSRISDNFIYIANNAKEKKAVVHSEDYKWNFLKYMESTHPFSEEYDPYAASSDMQYLVKKFKSRHLAGDYISFGYFSSKEYGGLPDREKAQLIDMIISTYNMIDYSYALKKYGSMERIKDVLENVGGAEYDVADDYDKEDYKHYYKMIRIANEEGYKMSERRYRGIGHGHGQMQPELAGRLIHRFEREACASPKEIAKFLHTIPQ